MVNEDGILREATRTTR